MRCIFAIACGFVVATAAHAAPVQWGSRTVEAQAGVPHLGAGVNATATDPTGDTFGSGTPQIDITSISAAAQGPDMVVTLTFAGTISPPDSGQPDALVGQFDIDRGPVAGDGPGITENFCPAPAFMGNVDAAIGLFGTSSTSADFFDNTTSTTTPIPASYTGNSATYLIPLTLLNAGGNVDFGVVVGTIPEPTDCAPDGAVLTASTIALAAPRAVPIDWRITLIALGLVLLVGGGLVLRRRTTA